MNKEEFEECKKDWENPRMYEEVWAGRWGERLITYVEELQNELIKLKTQYSSKNMLLGMSSVREQKILKRIFNQMEEEGNPFPDSL